MMHNYSCYYYRMDEKGVLEQNWNDACWAGLRKWMASECDIYIDDYRHHETEQYIESLVEIINEVTPCSLETINNKTYIKFKLFGHYDQSLILLNFIRNLWHEPLKGYSKLFFETMLKDNKYTDPLERLTYANKKASAIGKVHVYMGHSNVYDSDYLQIRTTQELMDYTEKDTSTFLTGFSLYALMQKISRY